MGVKCGECDGDSNCNECGGSGYIETDKPLCPECGGDRTVDCDCTGGIGAHTADDDCFACGGSGSHFCPVCNGEGIDPYDSNVN